MSTKETVSASIKSAAHNLADDAEKLLSLESNEPGVKVEETVALRLRKVIDDSTNEFDITLAGAIGALELVKADLISEAVETTEQEEAAN